MRRQAHADVYKQINQIDISWLSNEHVIFFCTSDSFVISQKFILFEDTFILPLFIFDISNDVNTSKN